METGHAVTLDLAGEIRAHLGRQGHSQRWLSAQTGIGVPGLSKRLHGKTPFTVDELLRVAAALGVTIATLLETAA